MAKVLKYLWKDKVFLIAFALAVASCFFIPPNAGYLGYVASNYRVLAIMFSLMTAVAGLYEANLFSWVAINLVSRFYTIRWIALVIVLATYFFGMWVTNDAVLLTLVPFTLFVTKQTGQDRHALVIVILQTIAANMGSALTPMGDPQNIYLYSFYNIPFNAFIASMAPIAITGFLLLIGATFLLIPNVSCHPITISPKVSWKRLVLYVAVFVNALLCVLRVYEGFEWIAVAVTLVLIAPTAPHLFRKVDYTLLLTFLSFFIFTGNMSQMTQVKDFVGRYLNTDASVYFTGLVTSQFISNVPASILLSTFTDASFWRPLLQGVNVGSMGTIIGSLASLITLKFVLREFPDQGKTYLKTYTFVSLVFIAVITAVVFLVG
jgi:Na+/H+ antiporter NhaD/arsenite permease-like protein